MANPFPPHLFDRSVASIERAYVQLGHRIGWRFLTGPRATLSPGTAIGFLTLNPGGYTEPANHPRASSEAGSAYLIETWPGSAQGGPGQSPEHFAQTHDSVPLKRGSTPADIGQAAVYLAAAQKVTAQILTVDGGAHMLAQDRDFNFCPGS